MGRSSTSTAVKKQSSDWSSSGWDADDSWSNEKDGQGQSSAGEEGWGNDWGEEETDTSMVNTGLPLPEGVRLASEYNWDSSTGKGQNDLFANVSQRNTAATTVSTRGDKSWRSRQNKLVLVKFNVNIKSSDFGMKKSRCCLCLNCVLPLYLQNRV